MEGKTDFTSGGTSGPETSSNQDGVSLADTSQSTGDHTHLFLSCCGEC